jgi:L-ascorbate metabolism protein UlaG (beta-lactamase superfamily)
MVEITYYGHACFGLLIGGKNILFDPFITDNPLASSIKISEIPCDYLLVSHGHGDHIGDVEFVAKKQHSTLISCFEITQYFENKGLSLFHPMNIGGAKDFEFGSLKMVKAVHSSSFPDGTYAGEAAGFVIKNERVSCYYAGDTALTLDMSLIGKQFSLDFAFLPIGDNFTMGVQDAVQAALLLNCKTVVGMHYNTFGYIEINKEEAVKAFANEGISLLLPSIGEKIIL